jgi:hypothetical protein
MFDSDSTPNDLPIAQSALHPLYLTYERHGYQVTTQVGIHPLHLVCSLHTDHASIELFTGANRRAKLQRQYHELIVLMISLVPHLK